MNEITSIMNAPPFSQEMLIMIKSTFRKAMDESGMADEIEPLLNACPPDERICLEFLYGCMPMTDLASYRFDLFSSFARAALRARKRFPWAAEVPEALFFSYVLFYRVNDEHIEDHRELFFEELAPRLAGKTMREAALEVNLWCCEKASYRSTDDRTASPLTVINTCFGRCGEESTLLVCALRSVGIPARQCYAPKWSHCDDNHAWVEAYIDGEWHYFGACEPEPEPDRAWFTHAASRAMLIHSRAFSPLAAVLPEETVSRGGCLTVINCLGRYAETRRLTVTVLYDGRPLPGAYVRFEVLNYSELCPIAENVTDETGSVSLLTGTGDLFLHIVSGVRHVCVKADTRTQNSISVDLSSAAAEQASLDCDVLPPSPAPRPLPRVSDSAAEAFRHRLEQTEACRRRREAKFLTPDEALLLARTITPDSPALQRKIAEFLVRARGNSSELLSFLRAEHPLKLKLSLLDTLTDKDMTDLRSSVLREHLDCAREYESVWPDDIFVWYVLSPRIGNEYLTSFRAGIRSHFSLTEKTDFQNDPARIADYIRDNIRDSGKNDVSVPCNPAGLLKLRCGSELSKRYLFVAVCRTFGIPSRINPVDGQPEYLAADLWRRAFTSDSEPKTGRLVLLNDGASPLDYRQNYTIAELKDGIYRTLCLDGCTINNASDLSFTLEAGSYRIITANRQIDGSVLARFYHTHVFEDTETTLSICLRKSQLRSRLYSVQPRCLKLTGQDGGFCELTDVLRSYAPCVLAVLDIGKEPTEHLLNEIIELKDRLNSQKLRMVYLIPSGAGLTNALFKRAAAAVPSVFLLADKKSFPPEQLFYDLNIGDRRLPLSAVINGSGAVVFAFSNYNVGTVGLLTQIAECADPDIISVDAASGGMYT